ncbi:MAG: class I SAM-dependent methyltransferase [Nitrosopumilaceae archaeon]|nr:class I SAM-dependent methyltransferase [Nitrosopumilaceae archaeon]
MNKLAYLAKFLVYSMSNPKKGREVINSKLQNMEDSLTNLYDYGSTKSSLEDTMNKLFDTQSISISEAKNNTEHIRDHISNFFDKLKHENYPSKKKPYPTEYSLDDNSGLFLYILCKTIKPEKIIETGVAYGLSSMYILQALKENNKGILYSIDSIFSPWQSKEMIGRVIPDELKIRWEFVFGSSSEKLKNILSQLNEIDIFFHDSLHTYKNMMFEFETAWPFITKNGLKEVQNG